MAKRNPGSLELIIGCMFSSKTSTLITRVRQAQLLGKNVMVIKHSIDTRYGGPNILTSHDHANSEETITALSMEMLSEIVTTPQYFKIYEAVDHIFIEEGQFFPDLYDFVSYCVDFEGKHIHSCKAILLHLKGANQKTCSQCV